jgi:hypothetical protein
MKRRSLSVAVLGLGLFSILAASGCNMTYGPRFGMFGYPIPLSPYFQKMEEDRFWEKERYDRVPVLEPFTPGGPTTCLDEPSNDQVMRVLGHARPIQGGLPFMHEVQRNNVRIQKELITDFVDPVREYPLIGPAQLHHARFRCTVYFSEVTRVGWPIPYTTKNEDAQEVVYIDLDHLHMVGNVDPGMGAPHTARSATVPIPNPAGASVAPPPGVPIGGRGEPQPSGPPASTGFLGFRQGGRT